MPACIAVREGALNPFLKWAGGGLALLLWVTAAWAEALPGLFWRLQLPERPDSYLLGTMHSGRAVALLQTAPLQAALAASDRLLVELDNDPAALDALGLRMLRPDGPPLSALLGEPVFRRLVEALAAYGMPAPLVELLQPWAAATTLLTPPRDAGEVLDRRLIREARTLGIEVRGLETLAEQLTLFEGLSMAEQLQLLREVLASHDDYLDLLAVLHQAYAAEDLARLEALGAASMAGASEPLRRHFELEMIDRRNALLFDRAREDLRRGRTLMAVGALHLPGEGGLLQRLRQDGFSLTPLWLGAAGLLEP